MEVQAAGMGVQDRDGPRCPAQLPVVLGEGTYRIPAALPRRLEKFGLEVAPDKTRILRFSRFHPGLRRRFAFLGFQLYWARDRRGELRS